MKQFWEKSKTTLRKNLKQFLEKLRQFWENIDTV